MLFTCHDLFWYFMLSSTAISYHWKREREFHLLPFKVLHKLLTFISLSWPFQGTSVVSPIITPLVIIGFACFYGYHSPSSIHLHHCILFMTAFFFPMSKGVVNIMVCMWSSDERERHTHTHTHEVWDLFILALAHRGVCMYPHSLRERAVGILTRVEGCMYPHSGRGLYVSSLTQGESCMYPHLLRMRAVCNLTHSGRELYVSSLAQDESCMYPHSLRMRAVRSGWELCVSSLAQDEGCVYSLTQGEGCMYPHSGRVLYVPWLNQIIMLAQYDNWFHDFE